MDHLATVMTAIERVQIINEPVEELIAIEKEARLFIDTPIKYYVECVHRNCRRKV